MERRWASAIAGFQLVAGWKLTKAERIAMARSPRTELPREAAISRSTDHLSTVVPSGQAAAFVCAWICADVSERRPKGVVRCCILVAETGQRSGVRRNGVEYA